LPRFDWPGEKSVPYNGKIADITHADTNKHTLDLATALSETRDIVEVIVHADRMSGTNYLFGYPNEGSRSVYLDSVATNTPATIVIAQGTNRLEYALGAANDDFDLYCLGYKVVGR